MKRVLGLLLAVCFLLVLSGCINPALNIQFNSVSKQVQTSITEINVLISQANTVLNTTNEMNVENNTVIQNLQTQINNMQAMPIQVPQRGADNEEIKAQIESLQKKVQELEQAQKDLQKAIDDIEASKRAREERQQREEDEKRRQEEQRKLDAVKPKHTQTISITDSYGYSFSGTIRMGDWIRASDTAMLNQAWKAVGGTGDFPELRGLYNRLGVRPGIMTGFSNTASAVVFGTIEVQNNSLNHQEFELYTYIKDSARLNLGGIGMVLQDSNGMRYPKLWSNGYRSNGIYEVTNTININAMRYEIPFAVIVPVVFTPNNPRGNPEIDDIIFGFGYGIGQKIGDYYKEFRIGKTW